MHRRLKVLFTKEEKEMKEGKGFHGNSMREKHEHVRVATAGGFLITRLYRQQTPVFYVYSDS